MRRRARPTRRAREKDGSGKESKRARLPEYSPTRRDRCDGGKGRNVHWEDAIRVSRLLGKVSIPMGKECVTSSAK